MTMKNAFLEIITAAFSAGEVKVYAMAGEYFEIIDSAYPVTVRLVDKYGAQRGIMRDAETSFFIKAGDFDTIEITSAQAQSIRFAFGSSEAGTRRTAGIVQVVDGSRALVNAATGFVGYAESPAAVANYSHVQLWNPAGSGKNLVVKSIFVTAPINQVMGLRFHNAALGVLSGFSPPKNKLIGSAVATVAELRHKNTAAVVDGTLLGPVVYVMANDSKAFFFNEPLIVPPGFGIHMAGSAVNETVRTTFDYFEVAI